MPEENYSFAQTRARLEDIVSQVRKKDVSLEKSLDLLEEGVRLANQCTELIDHADWEAGELPQPESDSQSESIEDQADEVAAEGVGSVDAVSEVEAGDGNTDGEDAGER